MSATADKSYKYAKHLYGRYISGTAADMRADSYRDFDVVYILTCCYDSQVPELSLPLFSSLNSPFLQCLTYISSLSFYSLSIIADRVRFVKSLNFMINTGSVNSDSIYKFPKLYMLR